MTAARAADGELQPALRRLHDALADLVEPQTRRFGNQTGHAPSLYRQLRASLPGRQCHDGGAPVPRSTPPIWVDCADLLNEIDTAAQAWQPRWERTPPTESRLRLLAARPWRPQDTRAVHQIADALQYWTGRATALLDPHGTKTVSAPCPACGAETVLRRDSGGEHVRSPALQIVAEIGCRCQNCDTTWGPPLYAHLALVIGCEPIPGVSQ